jgi:predicted DNA binding CopG/RHH family protein
MKLRNSNLFSRRGTACTSPALQLSDMIRPAVPRDADVNEKNLVEIKTEEPAPKENASLAGLICRRAPVRYNPARVEAGHEDSVVAARLETRSVNIEKVATASTVSPDVECDPEPNQATRPIKESRPNKASRQVAIFGKTKSRRQLTVRLENAQFAQFDQMAKSTGWTYQDILAKAIGRYLDDLAAGK